MTGWNNRIMKRFCEYDGWYYTIHEVYYDIWDTPIYWTAKPVECRGADLKELRIDYDQKGKAFDVPVIDYETGVDETYYYMWQ